MILVYSPKITNRLSYTLGLVFETLLGVKWELTNDQESYCAFQGAKINYSHQPSNVAELLVQPSGFLEKRGVEPLVPDLKWLNGLPCLFPAYNNACNLGFDVFSAVFFLVSRYEEYLPSVLDKHGRFPAEESYAFKHGFIEIPLADHYALLIKDKLTEKFPGLQFNRREYSFIPTYDIDVAYAYLGRGFFRGFGAALRSLLKFDFSSLKERVEVVFAGKKDPFDTYDYQLELHQKYKLKAFYFFLSGEYGPYDRNISVYSTVFHKLIKKISDYAYTGIHPSYATFNKPERLTAEVAKLSGILNREIRFSRQHFLKLKLPGTYRNLIRNNISNDFSMGYASQPGFRASVATPFLFYDLEREEITNLKIFPFAVMDGTLRDYLGLNPEQAREKINELIDAVSRVQGTFISLWHNDSLSERNGWQGWRQVYEYLVEKAVKNPG